MFLGIGALTGDKLHPKLNTHGRPIENKYREGKMKRTLKRGLKVPEIAEREAVKTDASGESCVFLESCTSQSA